MFRRRESKLHVRGTISEVRGTDRPECLDLGNEWRKMVRALYSYSQPRRACSESFRTSGGHMQSWAKCGSTSALDRFHYILILEWYLMLEYLTSYSVVCCKHTKAHTSLIRPRQEEDDFASTQRVLVLFPSRPAYGRLLVFGQHILCSLGLSHKTMIQLTLSLSHAKLMGQRAYKSALASDTRTNINFFF